MYSSTLDQFVKSQSAPAQTLGAGEAFAQAGGPTSNGTANGATRTASAAPTAGANAPVMVILGAFIFFVVVRYLLEAAHGEHASTFGEIKVSIFNVAAVTLFAIPGIALTKGLLLPHLNENNPVAQVIAAV